MKYTIKNNTGQDTFTLNKMVDAYFPYAQKNMGFDMPVTIMFESDVENAKNPLGKTAYYDPSNYTVVLYTDNRHPKDIMRSLSHELVHHKQNCNGELSGITGEQGYAQTGVGSRIEEEAYSLGNTCFRNWEDSLKKQINETSYSRRNKIIKENNIMNLTKDDIEKLVEEAVKNIAIRRTETPLEPTEAISEVEDDLEEGKPKPDDPRDVIKKKIRTGEGEEDKSWEAPLKNVSHIEEGKPKPDAQGEPLKEWYDNSLYKTLLKDYTRSKK